MPVTNVSDAQMKLVGATSTKDFQAKLDLFLAQSSKLESDSSPLLVDLQSQITDLSAKIVSEARVTEIVSASVKSAVAEFASSAEGKSLVAAEASRTFMSAGAATGTTPAKPAPASADQVETPEAKATSLARAGKYEEAFAAMPANLKAEYVSAKYYAAYMRATKAGAVKQLTSKN